MFKSFLKIVDLLKSLSFAQIKSAVVSFSKYLWLLI